MNTSLLFDRQCAPVYALFSDPATASRSVCIHLVIAQTLTASWLQRLAWLQTPPKVHKVTHSLNSLSTSLMSRQGHLALQLACDLLLNSCTSRWIVVFCYLDTGTGTASITCLSNEACLPGPLAVVHTAARSVYLQCFSRLPKLSCSAPPPISSTLWQRGHLCGLTLTPAHHSGRAQLSRSFQVNTVSLGALITSLCFLGCYSLAPVRRCRQQILWASPWNSLSGFCAADSHAAIFMQPS